MGDFNAEEIWFANAEADIRSIERAVRFLPNGFTGWVRLVENGVQIHIAQEEKSIDRLVAWHEMASWRCPMGGTQRAFHRNLYKNRNACFLIVTKMVAQLRTPVKKMRKL
jgi:acylphosphatase